MSGAHDPGPAGELTHRLEALRRRHRVPGLVCLDLGAADPPRIAVAGDACLEDRRPVQTDTIFRWYSLTKVVTATVVVKLADEGRLPLAQPILDVLPEVEQLAPSSPVGRWADVRVEHLLSHGSGLRDQAWHAADWFVDEHADWPAPRAFLRDALRRRGRLRHAPGTHYHYSNLGYALLGELVAEVTQRPFREHVAESLLRPLGMQRTTWAAPGPEASPQPGDAASTAATADPAPNTANGYVRRWSQMDLLTRVVGSFRRERVGAFQRIAPRRLVFSPHGGLWGPMADLARFLAAHVDACAGHALPACFPTVESVLRMQQLHRPEGRAASAREGGGHGWKVAHRLAPWPAPWLSHGGRGPGFTTEMVVLPDQARALAVLGNGSFDAKAVVEGLL